MSGTYRYCPVHLLEDAARLGWLVVGPIHPEIEYYGWLVFWPCAECPEPPWFPPGAND
jgi:hypothetical protein